MITSFSIFQLQIGIEWILATYIRDHTAGPDVVEHHAHALHAVHVIVLAPLQRQNDVHEAWRPQKLQGPRIQQHQIHEHEAHHGFL